MRKLKLFLCLWILLDVLAGYGCLPMPCATAQGVPPRHYLPGDRSELVPDFNHDLDSGDIWKRSTDALPFRSGLHVWSRLPVYLLDGSNSEAVRVTSGSTLSRKCSLNFTPNFSHGPNNPLVVLACDAFWSGMPCTARSGSPPRRPQNDLLYRKYHRYDMYYTITICIVHNPIAKLYFRGGENRLSSIPSEPRVAARHSADRG